jgi:uncharacterized protein (TIGR02270 family)
MIIPVVVAQHVEAASHLIGVRSTLVRAPHVSLSILRRYDNRLAAHLDGLTVAGDSAWPFCENALADGSSGGVFTAATNAIEGGRKDCLPAVIEVAKRNAIACRGLTAALEWLEPRNLQGIVVGLLSSADPGLAAIGVAACAFHRVDPGIMPSRLCEDPRPPVRARAFCAAGELGLREIQEVLVRLIADDDPECRYWVARSAVLLGDRDVALKALTTFATSGGPHRTDALALAVQAMNERTAHVFLQRLFTNPDGLRLLIQGCGVAGDSAYVPWLIGHMQNDATARLAGQAFSWLTGVDITALALERHRPEDFNSGPNDEVGDSNVEMDEDEGLPWPDSARISYWWAKHGDRFQPGVRHFMGASVTREHCVDVLKNGYQRQRILAAQYLSLLTPGLSLFNTSSPAWRQQRQLAEMA